MAKEISRYFPLFAIVSLVLGNSRVRGFIYRRIRSRSRNAIPGYRSADLFYSLVKIRKDIGFDRDFTIDCLHVKDK